MLELLERGTCLDVLAAAYTEAAGGAGGVVLVSGEAGIGKTVLVDCFARTCAGDPGGSGGRVVWGACEALFTPRPLGPLHDIAAQTKGETATLLADGAARPAIFSAFLGELRSAPGPTLVVVEDVHWADEATLDLLKFLGRRIHRLAVLLIMTYRDDEVGPEHPLRFVLGDLPHRITRRLRLFPLSEQAVATLAEAAGRPTEALYAVTGGNPFFVTEVLAGSDDEVPATVRDAVLARAARLSREAHEALEVVSVVPGRAERWLVDAVTEATLGALDACVHAGMLRAEGDALAFRHELARLAVEEALTPLRRRALHAAVLEALSGRGEVEVARLVYHAEQAGDVGSVRRYGPAAARQAAALSAHREAAAHYRTVLRFADGLASETQARWLEGRSYECYLTDQIGEALEARRDALEVWKRLGRRLEQGDTLRWMSRLHWFNGQKTEAERYAHEAVEALEALPASPELAMAYSNRAQLHMLADEADAAVAWGRRAIALAERFGATETLVHALNNVGAALLLAGDEAGWAPLEESLRLAKAHGLQEHAARASTNLGSAGVRNHHYARAVRYLDDGIAYTREHDLDSWVFYMTAWRARAHLEQGDWEQAAEEAAWVLSQYKVAPITKIPAMAVLGHVRARRGDPEAGAVLDEALGLAQGTAELQRIAPVVAARAEVAWWAGRFDAVREEVRACLDLARRHAAAWVLGEMAFWLWRDGSIGAPPDGTAEPYALQIRGDWRASAQAWRRLGCPYEEALALADGDPDAQREALTLFDRLGAAPAAADLRRRLREQGIRGLPRGPRPTTRANPAGLTDRQLEVLELLAEGLTNTEIAERLFIAPKTAGHHVSAVLAKLGVRSRVEAAALAVERGLVDRDGQAEQGDAGQNRASGGPE